MLLGAIGQDCLHGRSAVASHMVIWTTIPVNGDRPISFTNPPLAATAVSLQQVQFFEASERPEWEIDLDAVWIDDLPS
jgi:hypothetical protein